MITQCSLNTCKEERGQYNVRSLEEGGRRRNRGVAECLSCLCDTVSTSYLCVYDYNKTRSLQSR